jgi:predicted flap endonuclease-1-like 5' DNA nuclease
MAYPITEIPGLGAEVVSILKSDGIRTTIALLRAAKTPKLRLKIAERTGTHPKCVLDWATAADRMRIRGVGAEYAALLRAAGVKTVSDLCYRNPAHLVERMREANKRQLVRLLPKQSTVTRWIEDAKRLDPLLRY